MKTLADLKRQAKYFEWKLTSNSFYKNIPEHQANYRRVSAPAIALARTNQ